MKRSPLRKISKKKAQQNRIEAELRAKLLEEHSNLCQECGSQPDWRGLSKHELVFRSRGGSPIDPENCIMVCGRCHSKLHGIIEA